MSQHTPKKTLHRLIAKWSRWLHIYTSLASLAAILFFSITGLTLNHPDWFFRESTTTFDGKIDNSWLNVSNPPPANWDQSDFGHAIDKFRVVEFLRASHSLSGRVSEFLAFEDECEVTFQGPGYAATARIERATGDYKLGVTRNDLISVLNDLHKGRNTGRVWSIVIDVAAIVSTIVALSGFILIFYLKLNRRFRLIVTGIGLILLVLFIINAAG